MASPKPPTAEAPTSPSSTDDLPATTTATSTTPEEPDPKHLRINLTGVSETLFITLLARAQDAARPNPLLNDKWAAKLAHTVRTAGDYTFKRSFADEYVHLGCVLRARLLDAWTAEFLRKREEEGVGCTVLHLACGLDTRSLRLDWNGTGGEQGTGTGDGKGKGKGKKTAATRWIDVDVAEVVDLRRKLLSNPPGDYRLLTASVTDDRWLETIPADRPTLVVMEGLVMYLPPAEVRRLVARLCDRFPSGQIVFDVLGSLTTRMQALIRPVRQTGATMSFGLDDGRVLESVHSKLRLKNQKRIQEVPGYEEYPVLTRMWMWCLSWFPYTSTLQSFMRYEFGDMVPIM